MAYEDFYYYGFSYGEGNMHHIETAHDHAKDSEKNDKLAFRVNGIQVNHIGYTLFFFNTDTTVELPQPNKAYLEEAATLVEQAFQQAGIQLFDRACVTTIPVPNTEKKHKKSARKSVQKIAVKATEVPMRPENAFGMSLTRMTFRTFMSAHPQARVLVKALDHRLTQKFNL